MKQAQNSTASPHWQGLDAQFAADPSTADFNTRACMRARQRRTDRPSFTESVRLYDVQNVAENPEDGHRNREVDPWRLQKPCSTAHVARAESGEPRIMDRNVETWSSLFPLSDSKFPKINKDKDTIAMNQALNENEEA